MCTWCPRRFCHFEKNTFKFNRKWCVGIVKALHVSDDAKGLLFAHVSLLWFSPAYAVEYCTYLSRAGVEAKARCNNMSTFERVVERPNLVVDFPTLFCFFMYSLECSFIAWVFPIKLFRQRPSGFLGTRLSSCALCVFTEKKPHGLPLCYYLRKI